jgi:hypothetical protein
MFDADFSELFVEAFPPLFFQGNPLECFQHILA